MDNFTWPNLGNRSERSGWVLLWYMFLLWAFSGYGNFLDLGRQMMGKSGNVLLRCGA